MSVKELNPELLQLKNKKQKNHTFVVLDYITKQLNVMCNLP